MITAAQLRAMARGRPNAANMNSVLVALNTFGAKVGLDKPHRLAHFLAQVLHESGSFRYDKEIWGNTPAQQRYDTRTDLGNTKAKDGDGKLYMGRSGMQITGKANYAAFAKWAKKLDANAPDFVKAPDKVNSDPWEGLGPIWYWDSGNPTGKSLNALADDNNIEAITKRINGGLNGLGDRLDYYGRAALVLLGYGLSAAEIKKFQRAAKIKVDGDIGGETRMALHKALSGKNPFEKTVTVTKTKEVEVPKPVVPEKVEAKVKEKTNWLTGIFGGGGLSAIGLGWLGGMDWDAILAGGVVLVVVVLLFILLRSQIIAAVREIKAEVAG